MTTATQTETTNLIEKWDDVIFIQDDTNGNIEVARASWFKTMGESETYGEYGVQNAFEHQDGCEENEEGERENCECAEFEVKAYNFWNGSNHQTIVIESDTYDTRYSEITDEDKIAELKEACENAEWKSNTTGYQNYVSGDYAITRSQWQGDWSLLTITEAE